MELAIVIAVVVVALTFDYTNGFHDAANAIATSVSTRALTPRVALILAAVMNFVGALLGQEVAKTVQSVLTISGVSETHGLVIVLAGLLGAITWNIVTWLAGIPSSSSHALIGGLLGAGIAKAGLSPVVWGGVWKTVAGIVVSPALGVGLALVLVLIVSWAFVKATPAFADGAFRKLQFLSAAAFSLGHGGNDAQKTMGIITVLLYAHGKLTGAFHVPFWVVLSCQAAMALGTLMGGWRIVRTMGLRITRLTPMQGFCAETGGAMTLFMATAFGVPVSTTHTITGAIVGVGAARRVSAVRWNIAGNIVWAWVITMPVAGLLGAGFYELARLADRIWG